MRSLFPPKLPVSAAERQWIDEALEWLRQEFGAASLDPGRPVVLPTNDFFPDDYDGTEATLYPLFGRVCGYMGVEPACVRLVVRTSVTDSPHLDRVPLAGRTHGAAGHFQLPEDSDQPAEIVIQRRHLPNPLVTIAVVAHELGHVRLLGEKRIRREERPDHEPLTDLLTVYLGLGIFNANAAFQFQQFYDGQRGGWTAQRLGYLPETMFGYALARFASMRGERTPSWSRHLNTNVGTYFQRSMRFLEREQAAGVKKI